MKKILCPSIGAVMTVLLALTLTVAVSPLTAKAAGAVTDTISVCIGYFGWDEDQYVEKVTYNWRELDDLFGGALTTHEHVYSYYSGSRTYLVAARGFYIRDLLECAGIDFGSISRIDFFTKDQTIGAYRSFTKPSLFDMPRYYFPNLAVNPDTGDIYPYDGDDVYSGATRVEPMLALEDYTEWDSVGALFEQLYDTAMFSATSRFHLFFGQLSPTEANTSSAAKYVYKLFITFSGTPILSADETNIELKVGSDFRMSVNVFAEDSLLDEYVRDNLIWASSDERIVAVDGTGALTVKAEGEADITASYGSSSVSVPVRVSGDVAEAQMEARPGGNPDGRNGSGGEQAPNAGNNVATSADSRADNTDMTASTPTLKTPGSSDTVQEPEAAQKPETKDEIEAPIERGDVLPDETVHNVFMLSPEYISRKEFEELTHSILAHKYIEGSDNAALNNARREGMDEDAQQLILLLETQKNHMAVTAVVLGAFFASGFGFGVVSFKRKL